MQRKTKKKDKEGKIEHARDGTVFFDEIGNISLEIQSKLLRVLEERKFSRIGENIEREAYCLFIFATNKDLEKMVEEGRFLSDLYYRIETFPLLIPSLRERREEVPKIAEGIWRRINLNVSNYKPLTDEETEILVGYDFPGNIRELEVILKRVFRFSERRDRKEVMKEEIERKKLKEVKGAEENEWHCQRIYKEMIEGGKSFWDVVWKPYLKHRLNWYQLLEILSLGLKESEGSLKGLLPKFNIEERDYKRFLDCLRKQGIRVRDLRDKRKE